VAALVLGTPALADTMRSKVGFNTSIGQKTDNQPANGTQVSYQIALQGGDLDGCTVDVVESLYGREEGAWGIFDIAGDVKCGDRGGFSYTSSGSWDGNGFHAAGTIEEGSGTGEFQGVSGRVAQLGGGAKDTGSGTADISYEIVFDTTET
jgi:hypothetical protein